ncbi:MAG: DUF4080 domain-containing protein [Bacteroidales bacterium]|nr:DUF4080 domain-containing protein [Bacteroidales bacterium]
MILLWLDINSSYAHSSLALPAMHAQSAKSKDGWQWHVASGVLNTPISHFTKAAIRLQPQVIAATAWLFNHHRLLEVIARIKALLPNTYIILGGPEFLGDNEHYLRSHPFIDAVFRGEGEELFPQWLQCWEQPKKRDLLTGICTIDAQSHYCDRGTARVSHFDKLVPPEASTFFPFHKPFVQVETTRGCFNDCYFCVSGGDKPIRTLSVEQIRERFQQLVIRNVRDIRILDRTFNVNLKRTSSLLALFCEFSGVLRFHIEIHPALLTSNIINILSDLPNGLLHIEAGIQSLDDIVLESSGRVGNSHRSTQGIRLLKACNRFEIHADLIAGLPHYTLERIKKDVKELMSLQLDEIQLELLKLLPGTKMRDKASSLGIIYAPTPPYEVLATPSMSQEALYEVQQLSRLLDGWYNGKGEWRKPFVQLTLAESCFLDNFLHELMQKQLLEQPLSAERRGLLLYEFCAQHYPARLPEISVAWILAGFSLSKTPGKQAVLLKNQNDNNSQIRFYHLSVPTGDYWFGFDRTQERRKPAVVLRHPPN